jgi:hypothetical protein
MESAAQPPSSSSPPPGEAGAQKVLSGSEGSYSRLLGDAIGWSEYLLWVF